MSTGVTHGLTGRKQKNIDIICLKTEKINEAMITRGAKAKKKVGLETGAVSLQLLFL